MALLNRLKHAWNAFAGIETSQYINSAYSAGPVSFGEIRPDRIRSRYSSERTIISSIYTRLGIDCAALDIVHVRLDDQKRYSEDIDSGLNNCLTVEANIDQAARAFRQDIAMSIFEKGVIAIVPVDTTIDPNMSSGFDIKTMRIGYITGWYPEQVQVSLWNEGYSSRYSS